MNKMDDKETINEIIFVRSGLLEACSMLLSIAGRDIEGGSPPGRVYDLLFSVSRLSGVIAALTKNFDIE